MVVKLKDVQQKYLLESPVKLIENTLFDTKKLLSLYEECARTFFKKQPLQIAITSSSGSVYENEGVDIHNLIQDEGENKYSVLNEFFVGTYMEDVYNALDEMFGVTRGRFMVLNKHKRAYSYHNDLTPRLHIPVTTSPLCKFIIEDVVYHLPNEGQLYMVDTTKMHSALNLGYSDRLHIVFGFKNMEI